MANPNIFNIPKEDFDDLPFDEQIDVLFLQLNEILRQEREDEERECLRKKIEKKRKEERFAVGIEFADALADEEEEQLRKRKREDAKDPPNPAAKTAKID
jgi:hypothetical protein